MVKDIHPGSSNSHPIDFVEYNNEVYFRANDGTHGYELWKTDGTTNGTTIIKEICIGIAGSDPRYGVVFNQKLYFRARDQLHGTELWQTDGTANGTTLVKDIRPGVVGSGPWGLKKQTEAYTFKRMMEFMDMNCGNQMVLVLAPNFVRIYIRE